MDPNATLASIRELIHRGEDINATWSAADTDELTELVHSLDGWLSRGGFLPDAWQA